jgi:hypothetical protein
VSDDTSIAREVRAALIKETVPPVNLQAIHARPQAATVVNVRRPVYPRLIAAAAVLVLAIVFVPHAGTALAAAVRNVVAWVAPPKPLVKKLMHETKTVQTLAAAQAQVPFTIVAPAGLPDDARQTGIDAGPSGTWSSKTKSWTLGNGYAEFNYRRADGRVFRLHAERYDPRTVQSAYMWNGDVRDASGKPQRYDRFVWRNGDQMMAAVADGLTDVEIAHIREAMRGVPLPTVKDKGPHGGPRVYVIRQTVKHP